MSRRGYSSTYSPTTLVSSVANTDTTFTVAASTGAPATVPWTGVVDRGTSNEELVTVTAVSGTTYTVTRATDGQTAKAHASGAAFEHVVSARDFDEPNAHLNDTTLDQHTQYAKRGQGLAANVGAASRAGRLYIGTDTESLFADDGTAVHEYLSKTQTNAAYVAKATATAKGDLFAATASGVVTNLPVGTNTWVLTADSTQPTGIKWAAAGGSGIPASTLSAKGSLIGATAAATAVDIPVGANNFVLTADSAQAAGVKWAAVPSASGAPLARVQYAPGVAVTLVSSSTARSISALDATNLSISFVAPTSGAVLVRLTGVNTNVASDSTWGLITHGSTTLAAPVSYVVQASSGASSRTVTILVTGLTSGTTYTWDWTAIPSAAVAVGIIAQGYQTQAGAQLSASPTGGPAVMEVWSA